MDGFDLGIGATFRFVGRTDEERRALLESIEPVWDGNQVWFILAAVRRCGLAPVVCGLVLGLYLAMFVLLLALILRPVGFMFRNKIADRAGATPGTGPCWSAAPSRAAVRSGFRKPVPRPAISFR